MIDTSLIPPIFGIVGLIVAFIIFGVVMRYDEGSEKINMIGDAIHTGAMVFMRREYSMLALFGGILLVIVYLALGTSTAIAYIVGALASAEHAVFKQTDADVASFDAGYGSAYLARMVGQKRAREIFFLGRDYSAREAYEMGMVNAVVPHEELEVIALEWAREITAKSPTAQRMLKFAFNLVDDGLVGQQLFAGEATRLGYMTDEAQEGRDSFLEKRRADFEQFPWHY